MSTPIRLVPPVPAVPPIVALSLVLMSPVLTGSVAVALDLLIEQVALYRRPVEPGWPRLRRVP